MALRHLRRTKTGETGKITWVLYDPAGVRLSVFDAFNRLLTEETYSTKVRYTTVVARFIDYLYEIQVLGAAPVSKEVVNEAIDHYLALLSNGEKISLCIDDGMYADPADERKEAALRTVAKNLGIRSLAPGSWDNTLAPLNRFLSLCNRLEEEAREMALIRGGIDKEIIDASFHDYRPLISAVTGNTRLSNSEITHIKHCSLIGGVVRFKGKLTRPRKLKVNRRKHGRSPGREQAFPMEHFQRLINVCTHWRDKALWCLLAASGIRRSEALNLEWAHIDFKKQEVYVLDPDLLRYARNSLPNERANRFKGRDVSWTYLRQPYRSWFFELLRQYRINEYVIPADGNDYVFQYVNHPHQGKPLRLAADSTLNDLFVDAVKRAGIPGPLTSPDHVWTVHSLRHAYGVYMLNDIPIPGQDIPGLTESEVQMLMGHRDINSTRKYAKPKESRLRQKLEAYDMKTFQISENIEQLPPPIRDRIKNEAIS